MYPFQFSLANDGYRCPGFSGILDHPVNDQNEIDRDSPKIPVLDAQFDVYVENFMSDGFPQPKMKILVTGPEDNIPQQDGIKEHLTSLAGAKTWIMHPKRQLTTGGWFLYL